MRNKRIFITLIVIALLAILTTTAYAATSAHPAVPSIVGTWETIIPQSEGNPRPTFESLLTFFADGNMVEVNSSNPAVGAAAHGVWMGSGNNYYYTFHVFTFDEQGKSNGRRIIHGSLHMDGPDHFTGHASGDVVDVKGKVTKNVFSVDTEATRMEVELP